MRKLPVSLTCTVYERAFFCASMVSGKTAQARYSSAVLNGGGFGNEFSEWRLVRDELVMLRANVYRRQRELALAARCEVHLEDGAQRTPILTGLSKRELTPRERDVARRAVAGVSSAEIAQELGLSTRTVDNLLGRVYRKCETAGRDSLAFSVAPPPAPPAPPR